MWLKVLQRHTSMLLVIIVVLGLSIGYSAYNRELMISGEGIVRADVPIRITDVSLSEVVNGAESFNPEFTKDTTNMSVSLNSNGSVTYQVKVENKTGERIIVKDIKELINTNSSITYTIDGLEENKVYDLEELSFTITFHNTSDNSEDITLNLAYDMEVFDGYLITLVHDYEAKENVVFKENTTTSFTNLSLNDNDVVVKCNKGSIPKVLDNTLNVSNITSDSTCEFYENLNHAINSADTTENNLLLLKDDTNEILYTINSKMNLDFNGNSINGRFIVYDDVKLFSSTEKGNIYSGDYQIQSYEDAVLDIENMNLYTDTSLLNSHDTSTLNIKNSNIYNNNPTSDDSSVWLHGGLTTLNVENSYIEGPFAIGGQGGNININNSEIVAQKNNAINVNRNYCANIKILNDTKIKGVLYGINFIYLADCQNTVFIDGNDSQFPVIIGQTSASVRIHSNTTTTINYGKLYGLNAPIIAGTLITRDNLELVTEDYIYDGITYQYSYLKE